eukprot:TRINITY_DN21308_c0_g1_i1.p1 TRINITY_DN21308_c0_g1~~TRINITY_DN21308_c0_g1_i1.p1  ORF type:complete len:446 (+),score=80.52 TRINITY_DN21308_c0_g1_i1:42-1340(+)
MEAFKTSIKNMDVGVTCNLVKTIPAEIITDALEARDYEFEAIYANPKKLEQRKAIRSGWKAADKTAFEKARNLADPLLNISHNVIPFRTRAALKLADIDQEAGFLSFQDGLEQATFVDLCGAPGSWTEYMIWAIHTYGYLQNMFVPKKALGWGFSLKTENWLLDWALDNFHTTAKKNLLNRKNFALWGEEGDGDITNNDNLTDFMLKIQEETTHGVDLAMGDGGVICEADYENMETQLRRVILCEIIAMMLVLKKGGNFVLKVLDVTTAFSICMMWILYQEFEEVDLVKPTLSRPANSERYFIGKRRRRGPTWTVPSATPPSELLEKFKSTALSPSDTLEMLFAVNSRESTLQSFISLSSMQSHEGFTSWLSSRNDTHLTQQLSFITVINDALKLEEEDREIFEIQRDLADRWWGRSRLGPFKRKQKKQRTA